MLRPWYWPMKLRMRGRPLASIACFTAPSAAPVPESSKNTRVRFSDGRISRSFSARSIIGRCGFMKRIRKPYRSRASWVAFRTSGCTFPRLFVAHWLVRSMYSFPSTSNRREPFADATTMSASFVSSDQKYLGYSSVYRFQYHSAAPFVPMGGFEPFFAIRFEEGTEVSSLTLWADRHEPWGKGICTLRFQSPFQELSKVGWDRFRFLVLVVERHLHALRSGEHPTAPFLGDLIAQRE